MRELYKNELAEIDKYIFHYHESGDDYEIFARKGLDDPISVADIGHSIDAESLIKILNAMCAKMQQLKTENDGLKQTLIDKQAKQTSYIEDKIF